MTSRTLVLVRHSKASHAAPSDIERPLTKRGLQMAEDLAQELAQRLGSIDLLLVSPAVRARQTAGPLARHRAPEETRVEPSVYESGASGLLDLISVVPQTARTVVVVGHEPTISSLALLLHDADDAQAAAVSCGVPTATAVVLEVPSGWAGLRARIARIREVLTVRR